MSIPEEITSILADPNAPIWLYFDSRNTQRGPVSENDVKWMIAAEQINTQTYGWCPGLAEWVKMSEHPSLMPHFLNLSSMDEAWFYMDSNLCKTGPVDVELIVQMYKACQLQEDTLVWTTGQTSWRPIRDQPVLQKLLKNVEQVRIVTSELELDQLLKEGNKPQKRTIETSAHDSASQKASMDEVALFADQSGASCKDNEQNEDDGSDVDGEDGQGPHAGGGTDTSTRIVKPDHELTEEERARRESNREKRKRKKAQQVLSRVEATTVYITNLPLDVTEEEVEAFFRRAGTIRVNEVGRARVKLYKDEQGNLKGDGTVNYLNNESVDIAVEMLNGGFLRPNWPISVQPAKFVAKEDFTLTKDTKKIRKMQLAQKQAAAAEEGIELKKGLRMVVIKHFCSMKEAEDVGDLDAYRAEMCAELKDECERKCGAVDKVSVYPLHPIGPALILFKSTIGAQKCIELMDKRFFSGRRLVCEFHDGTEYEEKETEEDEESRLDAFGDWLEGK